MIDLKRYHDEAAAKAKNIAAGRILFYGSSTFARWETLEQDMLPYNAVNNGFGGSTAEEALYYYHLLVMPFKPSAVVYYEGDNDLADNYRPAEVLMRIRQFFIWVKTDFPDIPLFILLVKHSPARQNLTARRNMLNDMILKLAAKYDIKVIDTNKVAFGAEGRFNHDNFEQDGLHFNAKGNAQLAKLIKQKLSKTLK